MSSMSDDNKAMMATMMNTIESGGLSMALGDMFMNVSICNQEGADILIHKIARKSLNVRLYLQKEILSLLSLCTYGKI